MDFNIEPILDNGMRLLLYTKLIRIVSGVIFQLIHRTRLKSSSKNSEQSHNTIPPRKNMLWNVADSYKCKTVRCAVEGHIGEGPFQLWAEFK